MKTNASTTIAAPALGLIAWLLLPQTALCFHNPGTGRCPSSDPPAASRFVGTQTAVGTKRSSHSALANAADGSPSAQYEYGPFGEVIRATGPMAKANPFRCSTKCQGDETDLLYYGYRYYNASTGRWLSRDPIEERGGKNLYGFVLNAPVNALDPLGKEIAGGGSMQMNCRQPCEDFKRSESEQGRNVDNGGIVCCGGVKFICTWGAEGEKNARAKEIAKNCLRQHERTHLPSSDCNSCSAGPVKPTWKKKDKAACEEELQAHGVSKSCFENALSECGGDKACIDSVNAWIKSEETAISYYKFMCGQFGK